MCNERPARLTSQPRSSVLDGCPMGALDLPVYNYLPFVILRACDFFRHKYGWCRRPVVEGSVPAASTTALSHGNSPTLTTTLSFLSFRAKPRNLLCAIRVPP